jgi:hypothetical protein
MLFLASLIEWRHPSAFQNRGQTNPASLKKQTGVLRSYTVFIKNVNCTRISYILNKLIIYQLSTQPTGNSPDRIHHGQYTYLRDRPQGIEQTSHLTTRGETTFDFTIVRAPPAIASISNEEGTQLAHGYYLLQDVQNQQRSG